MLILEDQDCVEVETWVRDWDDGFGHQVGSMGNYMEGLGWMGHEDYGL